MTTPITQDDINGLAETLDSVVLSDNQKALLKTIIHLASKMVSAIADAAPSPSFSHQFEEAFTPGAAKVLIDHASSISRG